MKRLAVILVVCVLGLAGLSSCKQEKEVKQLNGYDMKTYLEYYWDNDNKVIYHESVYPLSSESGEDELELQLLYDIDRVVAVQNFNFTETYEEGKDYYVRNGKLIITKDSAIERTPYDYHYSESNFENAVRLGDNSKYTRVYVGGDIQKRMVLVTYTYTGEWEGPVPESKLESLPVTKSKLEKGENLNIVFYGDSITVGADSSGLSLLPFEPNIPIFTDMAVEMLRSRYPDAKITGTNTAVGGTGFQWAHDNVETLVNEHQPDLVFLAFGMNELFMSGQNVKTNYQKLIDEIRAKNPECEFVVVATMLPNGEIYDALKTKHAEFHPLLGELEEANDGVAGMDMTELHEYMLTRKRFMDMTGNNINHPNDFLARLYAQALLKTLS